MADLEPTNEPLPRAALSAPGTQVANSTIRKDRIMLLRLTLAGFLALSLSLAARAQSSLVSLVDEANYGWVFGQWKATTDDGAVITLNITWDLNRKVAVLHTSAGDMESKGYTVLVPGAENPTYFGADDRGAVSRGDWNYEGGDLVLRLETSRPNESPMKWAAVFAGGPSTGLEVRMHGIESWGGLSYPANWTLKFKKS